MSFDCDALAEAVANHGTVVRIVIVRHRGSVPAGDRDVDAGPRDGDDRHHRRRCA
ncbi:MAG: hypothetical protein AAF281_06135 [Pseudomonadota bacterium]